MKTFICALAMALICAAPFAYACTYPAATTVRLR